MFWTQHGDGRTVDATDIVKPGERLTWPRTVGLGAQHVIAMFGATFLVPLITGFPPSTTLLFSGLGTLLFLLLTKNRVPSYLGSSFAFLGPVGAAMGSDAGMGGALFGILVTGALLAVVGLVVNAVGTGWIHALMPPVVMGAIVALIGFNLAQAAWNNVINLDPVTPIAPGGKPAGHQDLLLAAVTLVVVVVVAALFRGTPAGPGAGHVPADPPPGGAGAAGSLRPTQS